MITGITSSDQYINNDIELILDSLLTLGSLNDQSNSELAYGELINGGTGKDTLVIYGTVDLSLATVRNIEDIRTYNSQITMSTSQFNQFQNIIGDGLSEIIFKGKHGNFCQSIILNIRYPYSGNSERNKTYNSK